MEAASAERASNLVEAVASGEARDRARALDAFEREPRLRQAVSDSFLRNLDPEEDLVCDELRRLTEEGGDSGAFAASFLPHAIKQVMSSVYHDAVDFKLPLHKYVIASNNFAAIGRSS